MNPFQQNLVKPCCLLLLLPLMHTLYGEVEQNLLPIGPSPLRYETGRIEPGQLIDCSTGQPVSPGDIASRMKENTVLMIGEIHDNIVCHRLQRDLIEALYAQHPKLIVGFEFFRRTDDSQLEAWRKGETNREELITATEWYARGALNFAYTELPLQAARKDETAIIGLNIPRSMARTISRQGFESLKDSEKALFPTIMLPNPEHEFFIRSVFGTMAVQIPSWFRNIYDAQKAWDVIMAESMHRKLSQKEFRGYKGVLIAGSNHIAYRLGIPFRYRAAQKKAKIITIVPIQLPSKEESAKNEAHPMMKMLAASQGPSALYSRGIADYVYAVPHQQDPFYPRLGISVKDGEQGLTVTEVAEDSLAERNGIRKGDRILSVDGVTVLSAEQLHALMAAKNWDDMVDIQLSKKAVIRKSEPEKKEEYP